MEYEVLEVRDLETTGDGTRMEGLNNDQLNWLPGPDGYNYNMLEPGSEDDLPPPNLRYDNDLQVWVKDYPVRTAGMPIRRATKEEMEKWVWGKPGEIGELADPDNFEIVEFLLQNSLSVKAHEQFLRLKKLEGRVPWASNYMMMKDVDTLPHRTKWEPKYYEIKGLKGIEKVVFWVEGSVSLPAGETLYDAKQEKSPVWGCLDSRSMVEDSANDPG
ncbi:hypothetical protein FRC11_003505 [Ceratobasidium sp. 423]|nr:hypothetical protein FRC11_003505 [Ceratobasidium sp. 423]